MKRILLIILIILLIPTFCIARNIYNADKEVLYIGGRSYFYAQPYENRDRSLRNKIIKVDIKNDKKEEFYQTDEYIGIFSLSPNGEYLAISKHKEGQKNYSIAILNSKKEMISLIKNTVTIYEWSPDSKYLAYITGELLSESREPFRSDGLWIYDIDEDKKEKISDKAFELRFARYDGKLHYGYERGKGPAKFYIYDPATKTTEQVDSFGMDFSPDGTYFVKGYEYTDFALYKFAEKKPKHWFGGLYFKEAYWLNSELIFNFYVPRSFVFDPFKKKVVHEIEGRVMGWSADRKYVVSYKNREALIIETLSGTTVHKVKIRD